jgi:hypothetical protein
MESGKKLSTQQLAEPALFLANEAIDYTASSPYHAVVRFAQSLSVFRELNAPNQTWIAFILFRLGKLKYQNHQPGQALAFFEAAGYLQNQVIVDQDAANLLSEMNQCIGKARAAVRAGDTQEPLAHQFEIQVIGQPKNYMLVTPSGEITWKDIPDFTQPVVYELRGWDIVCSDGI